MHAPSLHVLLISYVMHTILMSVHIDIDFDSIDTTELSKLLIIYAITA